MKKIFTMLFAVVATVSIASAQSKDFGRSKQFTGYSEKGKHEGIQKFNRDDHTKFVPFQMNKYSNSFGKQKQFSSLQNKCDEVKGRSYSRVEKSHYQHIDKRSAKTYAHSRW
jgi:hypothetical protein